MLLAHSSGLPAHEKFFLKARTRNRTPPSRLHHAASHQSRHPRRLQRRRIHNPRHRPRTPGRRIPRPLLPARNLRPASHDPHHLQSPSRNPRKDPSTADEREETRGSDSPVRQLPKAFPPQSGSQQGIRSTFRQRIIQGEVQDENASVLGGVAAHAGLFSTAEDLAKFAHAMLNAGHPILRPETVALFTRRESTPPGTSRALGWDTPSAPSQSGKYFSPQSFGHLGYTGTSLWIDPTRQLSVTLLTNRTWPDCSNQAIKQVRPKFHDAIIEALKKS